MLARLIHALVESENQAADDLLLQALRLGTPTEQAIAMDALLKRGTSYGLKGVIALYEHFTEPLQKKILQNIRRFHSALAECGRSPEAPARLAAMKLIALGRQGRLSYVLSENLHDSNESFSRAAAESIAALARWVSDETRRLQRSQRVSNLDEGAQKAVYDELMSQRPEIETAVARAMNLHRGRHGPELLRAALLLADWAGSKECTTLQNPRQGGHAAMIRRLQQPPAAEHVESFLLAGARGNLRTHFGSVFSHIEEAPVLDSLLNRSYWVRDHQLQVCMHQVTRGVWWGTADLARDLERRGAAESSTIAEWLAVSGIHDVEQDERMQLLLDHAVKSSQTAPEESLSARLRLLRVAMQRRRGASVKLIRAMLCDPDERILRMAAREIVRRKPQDFENTLLKLVAGVPASVRAVVGRAIGQAGFEQFWLRFDKLDKATRRQAGKAMLKLLPDAAQRLQRRAVSGPPEQRVKAMQIAQELEIAEGLGQALVQLCADANPRVRSKATVLLGQVPGAEPGPLIERLINDPDARVRANAIEVLEVRPDPQLATVLAERAMAANGRERANAIKALGRMKIGTASKQLLNMLRDPRPEHRISALWALRQIGWWQMVNEVGRMAQGDDNARVRRYAIAVLKTAAEQLREQKKAAG
jgi:HEAT repeat protein